MTRVEPIPREDLPHLEPGFQLIEAVMGFLPTSMRTMARVPGLAEGFQALAGAVMANPILDPGLGHMVSHVTSNAAGCRYCQAHTATTAANSGTDPAKIAALWEFETSDLFTDAERAALRLAFHAGQVPNAATDEDFAACREFYTEEEIASIVSVCALFGYLNRWNDTMATTLEAEPTAFATANLSVNGWEAGRHAS
ncbi:MAG: carboxymuconolactone decarboxylase family protein [Actinomycetota bacterium]